MALNDTVDQIDIIDTFRIFHPKATGYTFFSPFLSLFICFERERERVQHMSEGGRAKQKAERESKADSVLICTTVRS